mgnify:CR=1 FL=1
MGGEPLLRRDMILKVVDYGTKNGFFVYNPGQGVEYCGIIALYSLLVGTVGPGSYSLDKSLDLSFFAGQPAHAFWTVIVVGLGGAALQLLAVYRPPRQD